MAHSKISICNLSLAMLGAAPIRDFAEDNKRARMCDVFFDACRDLILSKFDWPFAHRYKKLQQLSSENVAIPEGEYIYQLPEDCLVARDIQERGSDVIWCVMGDHIHCKISENVFLHYTAQETNPSMFSDTFVNILFLLLAVRIGPPISQDKALVEAINKQYVYAQADSWETDANIGTLDRGYDNTPENDTFVSPPGVEMDPFLRDK